MLHTEQHGEVTLLCLAHGKASALDLELLEGLAVALGEIGRAGKALVLTGSGAIFSAGVDLFRLTDAGPAYIDRFLPALDLALERLLTFPRPTVAAINGHAIAGGCILGLACDRQVAARGPGRIGVPELLVGVPFPPLPLEIVRDAVPPARLAEVVYGGATYEFDQARELGLVGEVVEPDQLLPRALALAGSLAAVAPDSYALVKRQLRAPLLARVAAARPLLAEVEAIWAGPGPRARSRGGRGRTGGKKR